MSKLLSIAKRLGGLSEPLRYWILKASGAIDNSLGNVTALQSEVDTLQVDVDTLEVEVDTLQTEMNAAQVDIAAQNRGQESLTQPAWYVNSVTGSDTNSGAAAGTALQTLAELYRRTQGRVFTADSTVYLSGDFSDQTLALSAYVTMGVQIIVRGEVRTDATGTVSAMTSYDGSTSTAALLNDGGATAYAAHVGKFARVTSGAAINCSAPVLKAVAAGQFRPGLFQSFDYVTLDPAPGDTFAIEELITKVGCIQVEIRGASPDWSVFDPRLLIRDLDVSPAANHVGDIYLGDDWSGSSTLLYRVRFSGGGVGNIWISSGGGSTLATLNASDCYLTIANCTISFWGFASMGGVQFDSCLVAIPYDMLLLQGAGAWFYGSDVDGDGGIGCMDIGAPSGAGITVSSGAHLSVSTVTSYIWSTGNLCAYGIRVGSGSMVAYGVKPTATGGTSDTLVGGTPKAYGAIPYFEVANGAGIVVHTG